MLEEQRKDFCLILMV